MNSRDNAKSVVAYLRLTLYDDGSMSTEGHIGDRRLALKMLDSAREGLARNVGKPSILEPWGRGIEVPAIDVGASHSPLYPVLPVGDRK